jgi:2,5-diamino-6-(ribosylamino)-4(3H)-pyrimidinone 5'-phosphate reductase
MEPEKNNMPWFVAGHMRPKVIVNCAMSADGKIASRLRKQVRLSDEADMTRVHRLRNECDAILVGIGTVLADDPSLLVKAKYVEEVRQPLRVVLDSKCRIPRNAKVLEPGSKTIVVATEGNAAEVPGAEVISCGKERVDLRELLERLHGMGIRSILIEGGGTTIWGFIKAGLVDEFKVFISNRIIGGVQAPTPVNGEGFAEEEEFTQLKLKSTKLSESGVLLEFEIE